MVKKYEDGKMKYLERNKNINRGFRKLEVWKETIELFRFVKLNLDKLNLVSYKSKAQVEDSILSVSSNIAEGYCRRYLKENIQLIILHLVRSVKITVKFMHSIMPN